jgi:hypothetical protein
MPAMVTHASSAGALLGTMRSIFGTVLVLVFTKNCCCNLRTIFYPCFVVKIAWDGVDCKAVEFDMRM